MMKRTINCSECDAVMTVPPEGLTMTCEYCGATRPVPDAEKRKQQQRQEQRRQRAAEQQRQREKKEARRRDQTKQASRARVGSWVRSLVSTLLWILIPAVIIAVILHRTGVLDAYRGDTGEAALQEAIAPLRASGYDPVGPTRKARFLFDANKIYLDMDRPGCYAFALGASARLRQVVITGLTTQNPNRFSASVLFCVEKEKSLRARVALDDPGQLAWVLLRAKAPLTKTARQPLPTVRFRGRCSVRRSPDRRSPRIGYARRNHPYPLLETRGAWRRIRLNERDEGWAGCKDLAP